ncbi:hypothetical protein VCHA50P415_20315 [Vibrio chagasii]|nr:hypothetical protein VCHA35O141_120053 [Vibrio chagasii]CAH6825764.1 hypothetical protein VCHA36P166_150081 [Vibrio chagasii]CAH6838958.1 hypothetical protein VCHA35O143_10103 [Vibrio chagasii]CAH6840884.1 hypothetical protein VCHA31O73_10311 [Vibrio chagasii]CAH6875921.1 hypothetical protein VCHA32O87_260038 [Vibrio chagasii]
MLVNIFLPGGMAETNFSKHSTNAVLGVVITAVSNRYQAN